jgi:hypothetical protein
MPCYGLIKTGRDRTSAQPPWSSAFLPRNASISLQSAVLDEHVLAPGVRPDSRPLVGLYRVAADDKIRERVPPVPYDSLRLILKAMNGLPGSSTRHLPLYMPGSGVIVIFHVSMTSMLNCLSAGRARSFRAGWCCVEK